MPNHRKTMLFVIVSLPVWQPHPAAASGQLPPFESNSVHTSFRACKLELKALYEAERAQVEKGMASTNPELSHQLELQTDGVRMLGKRHAQYQSTIWFHHSKIEADIQQIRTTHSYERHDRVCLGKVMTHTSQNGFTSETFEAIKK